MQSIGTRSPVASVRAASAALAVVVSLTACGSAARTPTANSPVANPPSAAPLVLDASHAGRKNPQCGACHGLPVAGHQASQPPACAACHGANGACNPNDAASGRRHAATDDCVGCHQQKHQFHQNADCVSCHFASAGLDDCSERGTPGLSGTLVSGCFDWPATEFSDSNQASVRTFLAPGARAVDFTLDDPDGGSHTLSDLLATRPVLLVHGSFT